MCCCYRARSSVRRPIPHQFVKAKMSSSAMYVHGYHPRENERLQDQAGTLINLLHGDTAYPAGSTVLEVGCGVGAQTVPLAQRSPAARFTSMDLFPESIAAAREKVEQAG